MLKYYNKGSDENIINFLNWLDGRVTFWSSDAYNIANYVDNPNAKIKAWLESANKYLALGIIDGYIYARYGYAVEELTNIELQSKDDYLPSGYSLKLQPAFASTRPDIVIGTEDNASYAWIDITSSGSEGHIFRKDGAQWRSAPFVVEVLYPALNLTLMNSHSAASIAEGSRAARVMRHSSMRSRTMLEYMVDAVDKAVRNIKYNCGKSKALKITPPRIAYYMQKAFGYALDTNYKYPIINSIFSIYNQIGRKNIDYVLMLKHCIGKKNPQQNRAHALAYVGRCYSHAILR